MSDRKHWGLKVISQQSCHVTREADPTDEWSSEDTQTSVTVVELRADESYPDVVVPFEPVNGETLYLVWITRYTGDTFHTDGGIFEPIAVYRDERKALMAAAMIRSQDEMGERCLLNPDRLAVLDETGVAVTVPVSWSGYFDGLETVEVGLYPVSVKLKPASGAARVKN